MTQSIGSTFIVGEQSPNMSHRELDRTVLIEMSLVHHVLDRDDFVSQIKEAGPKLVLVDFYAPWCGPCKLISPELDKLSKTYSDVIFMKVDVDQIEELASEYEISSMPTIIAFLHGQKVGTLLGATGDKLLKLILELKN